MVLYVKNMVCNRCIMVVRNELEKLGIQVNAVSLGETDVKEITEEQLKAVKVNFSSLGFELIDDRKSRTVEQIKNKVVHLVHHSTESSKQKLSEVLAKEIGQEYSSLSKLFSEVEGVTIEQYYILQRIERVKELLVYDELSLSEIAALMDYSSTAYLSNQFRKVTGLNPSHFKKVKDNKRTPIEDL